MSPALFAFAALVPAMLGPQPLPAGVDALVVRVCNGGTVTILLPGREREEPAPCHQKGCHSGCSRKRPDPGQ